MIVHACSHDPPTIVSGRARSVGFLIRTGYTALLVLETTEYGASIRLAKAESAR